MTGVATLIVSAVAGVVALGLVLAGMAMMLASHNHGWGLSRLGYAGFAVSMVGVGLLTAALAAGGGIA